MSLLNFFIYTHFTVTKTVGVLEGSVRITNIEVLQCYGGGFIPTPIHDSQGINYPESQFTVNKNAQSQFTVNKNGLSQVTGQPIHNSQLINKAIHGSQE